MPTTAPARRPRPLTPRQRALVTAMRRNVMVFLMPYCPLSGTMPYAYRNDTEATVTDVVRQLERRGVVALWGGISGLLPRYALTGAV